ncbi:hypothetical protein ABW19_dt0209134 [Dactylella cylindrospora]|nr:hypothetical protein ABW19_dt0209134 [Dactylella cylindrospora]
MVNPSVAAQATRRHRLVRRQTFGQRIASFLNPLDNLLAISLIFETFDWEGLGESIATPVGIGLNLVLMITRANSSVDWFLGSSSVDDEILISLGNEHGRSRTYGILSYAMSAISYFLLLFSIGNAIYTLNRAKPYRLFETSVHANPPTPSARRVRVSSNPNESTPTRIIKSFFPNVPYATTPPIVDGVTEDEVWEVAMWDPPKFNLSMLTYFSPLHTTVIFLHLPYIPPPSSIALGDVPSTTYNTSRMSVIWNVCLILTFLTVQNRILCSAFDSKLRDARYLNSQVFSEYNKKFVAPRVNVLMRDVGTSMEHGGYAEASVSTATPGFKTHANPVYTRHTVPGSGGLFSNFGRTPTPTMETPSAHRSVNGSASRHSTGIPTSTGSTGRAAARKSFATGDLVTPARKVAAAGGSSRATPTSNGGRVPGRNGNLWGGNVDYGVVSPMKRTARDRGI